MLWVVFFVSSILLGIDIIPFLKIDEPKFSIRLFTGWLVGSTFAGFFTFISNFVIRVHWVTSILLIIFQSYIWFYLRKREKNQYSKLSISNSSNISCWSLFFLTFLSGISLIYLSKLYSSIPQSVPYIFKSQFEEELSFVMHVLKYRRSNLFFNDEPRLFGFYFRGSSIPLFYVASLMSLGASYSTASILIIFMNILSIAIILLRFFRKNTIWYLIPCFYFFFSAPSATRLINNHHNRIDIKNDLVHQLDSGHQTIAYQMLFSLLSLSKMASYTVAFTQYAFYFHNGLLALFIPNTPGQIGVFLTLFLERKSNFSKVFPYVFGIFFRIFPFNYSYFPLFREEAMRGTLFAAFKIWIDSFSIMLFSCLFAPNMPGDIFYEFLPKFAGFCITIFLRETNDRFVNYVAAVSIIYPTICMMFSIIMKISLNYFSSEELKGCMLYVHWAVFFYFVVGSFICAYRILLSKEEFIGKNEIQLLSWLSEIDNKNTVLFVKAELLHLAIMSGRPLFLGNKKLLYLTGYTITKRVLEYKEIIKSNFSTPIMEKYNIQYVIDTVSNSFLANISNVNATIVRSNSKYKLLKF